MTIAKPITGVPLKFKGIALVRGSEIGRVNAREAKAFFNF